MLSTHLVLTMAEFYPPGDAIFQQYLALCHNSKKMKHYFDSDGIRVLDWPGNSADLNPIENLWAIKQRHCKCNCTTMKQLYAVIKVW